MGWYLFVAGLITAGWLDMKFYDWMKTTKRFKHPRA